MGDLEVTAVLVTRGNVELDSILQSLPPDWPVVIWDNSQRTQDLSVYGRYAALAEVETPLCYVQDDDVVVDKPEALWEAWMQEHERRSQTRLADPEDWRNFVICNQPLEFRHSFYADHALVGFGSCFHRDLPAKAFERFWSRYHGATWEDIGGEDFYRHTCDIVFTALTPFTLVDIPVENLPWATDPERMYRQPEHVGERKRMLELALRVRDGK